MKILILALVTLLTLFCQVSLQAETECSKTKLCKAGCCSSAGFCGYGPDYCGKGCLSTCTRKSDCNPGWKSDEFSAGNKCPLNVCCSKHGFCGYTEEFCGKDDKVKRPSCSPGSKPVKRVIGYYESWSTSQRSCLSMMPEEIPYGMYTHVIFSFATINPKTFTASAGNDYTRYMMTRIGALKLVQPDVKIWIAFGGWAFNDPGPTQSTFSDLAASAVHTQTFIDSLVQMMNKYEFDGVDIDWEYPVDKDRHGKEEDYKNAVKFMKKLRSRMDKLNKGVSMALPASYWYLQNFDIKKLESTVDWFNLMTYDVHGSWDIDNKWTGPWVNSHTNLTEIQLGLDLLWRNDISPSKVTMGMSFYSRTFTLTDAKCNTPGCRISSAGNAGRCSDTVGVLLHPEIQEIVKKKGIVPTLDRKAAVKTVSWDNQWTSFDDIATWRLKANLARSQCIESFMVWALSHDDASATNAKALNSALGRKIPDFPDFTDKGKPDKQQSKLPGICRWTSCYEDCPSGYKAVQRDGHKEVMMDTSHCDKGLGGPGFSRLCCPSSHDLPTCTWRGHRNSGHCKPGCNDGEVEVGTLRKGCSKNHQSACCKRTEVTAAYDKCYWTDCYGSTEPSPCLGDFSYRVATSSIGSGGHKQCSKDKTRSYCCSNPAPVPFGNTCKWVERAGFLDNMPTVCEGACHKGQVRVALEKGARVANFGSEGCDGELAFCCDEQSEQEKRDDDDQDSSESSQTRQFQTLMDSYLDNPTCPATILQPEIHDAIKGSPAKRRDLKAEANEYDVLHGRATDCSTDNWTRLLAFAMLIFSMSDPGYDPIRRIWNSDFAGSFDSELEVQSLRDFFTDFPMYEQRGVLEYVLLNPQTAGPGLRRARGFDTAFCQISPSSNTKRSEPSTSQDKRFIYAFKADGRNADIPTLTNILGGIERGDLSLHYARWQWQSGSRTFAPAGPFLELAYWIGPVPGVPSTDSGLTQYQDNRARGLNGADRWVVFHFHIDPARSTDDRTRFRFLQRGTDGHTYMGVTGMTVYHGQDVRPAENANGDEVEPGEEVESAWRVENQGGTQWTARNGFYCHRHDLEQWFVGAPVLVVSTDPVIAALQTFGERLWRQGYVARPGLQLILQGGSSLDDEIDPENPGSLIHSQSGTSSVIGNLNPYNLNWLYDNGYNVTPNPPPDD
ncbi:chitinase [Ilyonectria sp. MPI-CAGE-AT-0026]|nr:chitinase [Ilyonectria sp. MPI-CAGE-AT-0026]